MLKDQRERDTNEPHFAGMKQYVPWAPELQQSYTDTGWGMGRDRVWERRALYTFSKFDPGEIESF